MIWMKNGIFNIVLTAITCGLSVTLSAQPASERFDRPSLCLMMISHPEQAFGKEIEVIFREMDMPERFYDHSLGVRVVKFPTDNQSKSVDNILSFATQTQLAKKMVAKWFDRKKETGTFSTALLETRGYYNLTKLDVELALKTIEGMRVYDDMGEKLISHTFLVVNEYSYDRTYSSDDNSANKQDKINAKVLDTNNATAVDEYNNHLYQRDNRLKKFAITCTSYLFRLQWTDSIANIFYLNHYTENVDESKVTAFMKDHSTYTLSYVGQCSNFECDDNSNGRYTNQQLIKKACIRLRDKNLSTLQHAHPEFRIKAKLIDNSPLKAYIGMKEDVTPNSRYEALELQIHNDGTYGYKRVGIIRPVANMIWDNRYMASDDVQSNLDATYFEQVSGGELYPGLLIREMNP